MERLDGSLGKLDETLDRIDEFYDMLVRDEVSHPAPAIAGDMGMEWVRTLDDDEMASIEDSAVSGSRAEGISEKELLMFCSADLVMQVLTPSGADGFVVVEHAYIAGHQAIDRVVRRSMYMTRFTGRPTYAAITSVRNIEGVECHLTRETPQPSGAQGRQSGVLVAVWGSLAGLKQA